MSRQTTFLGQVDHRDDHRRFGIRRQDRLSHIYVVGKTGSGKSTLLEAMALQDLSCGIGFCLIDPHGDLVERLFATMRGAPLPRIIYLDATDPKQPYGYNPLRQVRSDRRPLAASGLLEVFKKMWADAWGVRMEHILRNALYALLDQEDATLADILRLLDEKPYRLEVMRKITNPQVYRFWKTEFPNYSFRYRADSLAPIQNKVGAFLADPMLKRILTEPEQPISFRSIMDEGKVLLVNLAKGRIGEDSASLLGGLLVTTIGLAAFSRADMPPEQRRNFFLYVDEFQNFTTLSIVNIASELRKYGVGTTFVHQYLQQLEPDIRHAVIGNAGTLISFRLGAHDAGFIAKELQPKFNELDLISLPNHHFYIKLMIDGMPSKPFSATSLDPRDQEIRQFLMGNSTRGPRHSRPNLN